MTSTSKLLLWVVPLLTLLLTGCGQQKSEPRATVPPLASPPDAAAQRSSPAERPSAGRNLPDPTASPQSVVSVFLGALRSGDEVAAEYLLTTRAREETAKHSLKVQPPGAPSASYQVGPVEYVTEAQDGAHVRSTWTERDETGSQSSYEIIWVLRRQSDGWRVAGMATLLDGQELPLFLNFENPQDMIQKWIEADPELAAHYSDNDQQPKKTAAQPSATTVR